MQVSLVCHGVSIFSYVWRVYVYFFFIKVTASIWNVYNNNYQKKVLLQPVSNYEIPIVIVLWMNNNNFVIVFTAS